MLPEVVQYRLSVVPCPPPGGAGAVTGHGPGVKAGFQTPGGLFGMEEVICRRGENPCQGQLPVPLCLKLGATAVTRGLSFLAGGSTGDIGFHEPGCELDQQEVPLKFP